MTNLIGRELTRRAIIAGVPTLAAVTALPASANDGSDAALFAAYPNTRTIPG